MALAGITNPVFRNPSFAKVTGQISLMGFSGTSVSIEEAALLLVKQVALFAGAFAGR